jgi:hypothetical protein
MASTKKGRDHPRRAPPKENRSPQGPHSPDTEVDKELPDDGGSETDRGTVVKQDRNFDDGPSPASRK